MEDEEGNGKLVLDDNDSRRGKWRISWAFEDDIGGSLGQNETDGLGEAPADRGNWEHWAASKAVKDLPEIQRDGSGFYWETQAKALKALRVAKESLKQDRPMPEWAVKALEAGWKPPKNWKA